MQSQNKPSSGTVGTTFNWGLVSKVSFPIGFEYMFLQLLIFLKIYLFLISFQHTCACVLQAQDLPFRTYEIRKDFFFAFCALLFSKKRKFCWPWASLLPVACVWHCFYSWDCILVLTVQKDSVCIQGDFLSWKFSWLKASLLSSTSWAISHLLATLNPNGQSWRL